MKVQAGPIRTNVPIRRKPRGARGLSCQALEDQLRAAGWKVTSRGWPKYFAWKDGKPSAIVPGTLNSKQAFLFWWFERHGIECYSWTQAGGFVRFDSAKWKLQRARQVAAERAADAERGTEASDTP